MKLLVSYDKFSNPASGGAQISLLTLLNGLAHDIDVVEVHQTPPVGQVDTAFDCRIRAKRTYQIPWLTWVNLTLTNAQWARYLRQSIQPDFDLLITQTELAPASVSVAAEVKIPSLFFVRGLSLTGYEKYDPRRGYLSNFLRTDVGGKVQYPFLVENARRYRKAFEAASVVVANSAFTARRLDELFGVESEVVYPPIDQSEYRVEYDPDGFITMVNPRAEYKGADVVLDLAERLTGESFLLAGPISSRNIEHRARSLPNVTHREWSEDMRSVYSDTKLVLVPSRIEESFGRVPAEAMVSGIPCVVSDRGGLPEVVGNTGVIVEDFESVEAWVAAIERAVTDHDPVSQRRRAKKFSAERQIEKLSKLIDMCV